MGQVSVNIEPIRICADYGDTSREIRHGLWTIVGQAMGNVSKLEQKIKGKGIRVAVSNALVEEWTRSSFDKSLFLYDPNLKIWTLSEIDSKVA